jgi:hypothetical protein
VSRPLPRVSFLGDRDSLRASPRLGLHNIAVLSWPAIQAVLCGGLHGNDGVEE